MASNQHINKVMFGETPLIDLTPTTAIESDVVNGKIFFKSDGSMATGNYKTQSKSATPSETSQTIIPDSNYNALSQVYISGDANLISENIASGVSIFGVPGTHLTNSTTVNASSWSLDANNYLVLNPCWKLLGSKSLSVSTTSTTAASAGTITGLSEAFTKAKIIYIRVRDTAGKRAGYFAGSDSFFINYQNANNSQTTLSSAARVTHRYTSDNKWGQTSSGSTTGYGVYAYSISSDGTVDIYKRYNSSYSLTINGTYLVEVFALEYPDGKSIYSL